MSSKKQDIRILSEEELVQYFVDRGEQAFRGRQLYEWLWRHPGTSFQEMTTLSLSMRNELEENFVIHKLTIDKKQISIDGTIKNAFQLYDGNLVEGVMIPTDKRRTACVSSQVGCSLSCKFCATGYMKRMRNLSPYEIFDQVVALNQQALEHNGKPLSNIVYMGMGEPLLNYKNVMESIERITSPKGLGMSPKRITLSTAGIAKMIKKLADEKVKFNLALSLHAADDAKRNEIMPINEQNSIEALVEALNYFYDQTKNKITFEYILLAGVNDQLSDAEKLEKLCRRVPAKVNIIEFNPIANADFKKTSRDERDAFIDYLEHRKITASVRKSRGKDIDAACGQLANK